MRKEQITQEVIDLARKISEHRRMEICVGCWVGWNSDNGLDLVATKCGVALLNKTEERLWFPIPDIHDCLEKLRELDPEWRRAELCAWFDGLLQGNVDLTFFHEALLQALLSVLSSLEGEK